MKVLVVGLDGATFDIIKPWIEKGKLPNISRIMKEGVHGELISTLPPITSPAWSSILTGKNPGKHGVFSSYIYDTSRSKITVLDSTHIKSKPIWNILSNKGRRVIVLDVPMTYPPERVNGVMISSAMFTPGVRPIVYPKELEKEMLRAGYMVDVLCSRAGKPDEMKKNIVEKTKIAMWLTKKYNWDFFFLVFMEPDQTQHHYFDKAEILFEIYRELDNAIGALLRSVSTKVTIVIVSDHGFGPWHRTFLVNSFLHHNGLIRIKTRKYFLGIILNNFSSVISQNKIFRDKLKARVLIQKVNDALIKCKIKFKRIRQIALGQRVGFSLSDFDYSKTKAFSSSQFILKINAKGKEKKRLSEHLIRKLLDLRDPETGKKVVKEVYKSEDAYWGPCVDAKHVPDLVMEMEKGYNAVVKLIPRMFFESEKGGVHSRNGIFMISGPNIKSGQYLKSRIFVWDIVPTILHMMEIPVPVDVDGKVLKEVFEPKSESALRETKFEEVEEKERRYFRLKKEEEEEVKERLRALGYLD